MITDVCKSMVARLEAAMTDCLAELFPDELDDSRFVSRQPQLLVHYVGSKYSAPQSIMPMSAERRPEFVVAVFVRSLQGDDGAPEIIDRVIRALFGFIPTRKNESNVDVPIGGQALFPVSDDFVTGKDGVWRFDVTFTLRTTTVEDRAALTGPKLTTITYKPAAGTPGEV